MKKKKTKLKCRLKYYVETIDKRKERKKKVVSDGN